jgi:hypothetical protein
MGEREMQEKVTWQRELKEMVHREGGRNMKEERGGGGEGGFKNLLHYNSV